MSNVNVESQRINIDLSYIYTTRQSEMANTSPRPMPVLGNVHPIKIEKI